MDVPQQIKILIADEHSLFRQSLRHVLEDEDDLVVVAEATDRRDAVREAERSRPDVAIVDVDLRADAIRTTHDVCDAVPRCRVLLLVSGERHSLVADAIEAGASAVLTKESPVADLVGAIRAVHRGETVVPPKILGPLLQWLIRRRHDRDDASRRISRLTHREREVLRLVAEGADNEAIGRALVISPQTARTHVQNILAKLEVHSRLEAAALVRLNGAMDDLEAVERRGPVEPHDRVAAGG